MEEGPEPHEWVERAAEEHHHGHEHGSNGRGNEMTVSAITAAVLAVLAAIGSLLSGHAVNQAILEQTKATDQWAYYQAKSTKGHVYLVGGELIKALSGSQGQSTTAGNPPAATLKHFQEEADRFDREKEEVKKEAEHLEAESQHEFHKHHQFALAIACFQVGIVLASVSILVRIRAIYYLSLVAGAAGLVGTAMGLL